MKYAVDHYPTVRAALEQVNATAAGVGVARAAYLPRLDAVWQSNRATANNVFGQLLPQSVIPAISGPGAAVGVGPERVGQRRRRAVLVGADRLRSARRGDRRAPKPALARARASEALTRLDVQSAVGARVPRRRCGAQRAVSAAQADVDRRDVLARAVHTLVDNQLRPGAEASRADAERAAAQTRLIQARQRRRSPRRRWRACSA